MVFEFGLLCYTLCIPPSGHNHFLSRFGQFPANCGRGTLTRQTNRTQRFSEVERDGQLNTKLMPDGIYSLLFCELKDNCSEVIISSPLSVPCPRWSLIRCTHRICPNIRCATQCAQPRIGRHCSGWRNRHKWSRIWRGMGVDPRDILNPLLRRIRLSTSRIHTMSRTEYPLAGHNCGRANCRAHHKSHPGKEIVEDNILTTVDLEENLSKIQIRKRTNWASAGGERPGSSSKDPPHPEERE